MPRKRHRGEQLVAEVCRGGGIRDGTFYKWKKLYAGLDTTASQGLLQELVATVNSQLELTVGSSDRGHQPWFTAPARSEISNPRCVPGRWQLPLSSEAPFLWAELLFGERLFEARPHFLMGQHFAPGNLRQAFFYLIGEPLVVVCETLDGFSCQRFGITSALSSKARELGLHIGAKRYFHA
jgi:hypothetical protein